MAAPKRTVRATKRADAPLTPAEVVELAAAHDLAELEVEAGGVRVRVVRRHAGHPAPARAEAPAARLTQPAREEVAESVSSSSITIESPMVGTFYRSASPDGPSFVNEGDAVKEGQTLCIIEAMKLMNEIESKIAGRIIKVLVDNAQPVQFGQPLFLVEPHK